MAELNTAVMDRLFELNDAVFEIKKLLAEAEAHRVDYNKRLPEAIKASSESFGYWKGRHDEAGHFRDRITAILNAIKTERDDSGLICLCPSDGIYPGCPIHRINSSPR